jgi:UDP-glucose 4-epimerase
VTVLVCGGAGYIGSHMVRLLREADTKVRVFDDLSTGHREAIEGVELVIGRLQDRVALDAAFAPGDVEAVIHFAAKALVGESVADPLLYYDNNVIGTLSLLETMQRYGVQRLVFSSSCAIYGVPETDCIAEDHPKRPVNPYGASKWMCEQMIGDAARIGLRSVCLRYFNAAGAALDGSTGESHDPETHLIPNALRSVLGQAPELLVHGTDYPTPDGTCIRDYVHVLDLADAHARALDFLRDHDGAHAFNLGTGQGASVLEVIAAVARVAGCAPAWRAGPRRPGDPPRLVADATRARRALGWQPRHSAMDQIVASALAWHRQPRY